MKSILKQVVPAANGENVWMVINIVYRQKKGTYTMKVIILFVALLIANTSCR